MASSVFKTSSYSRLDYQSLFGKRATQVGAFLVSPNLKSKSNEQMRRSYDHRQKGWEGCYFLTLFSSFPHHLELLARC